MLDVSPAPLEMTEGAPRSSLDRPLVLASFTKDSNRILQAPSSTSSLGQRIPHVRGSVARDRTDHGAVAGITS